MVDNDWIRNDRARTDPSSRALRMKIYLSIAVLLVGGVTTALIHNVGTGATLYQAEGIVVDFGDYLTYWSDIDYEETEDPKEMLDICCGLNNITYTADESGIPTSVTGLYYDGTTEWTRSNTDTASWGLWLIDKGSNSFYKSQRIDVDASDYKVVAWAYVEDGEEPTVSLDATGNSIYGYSGSTGIVTLSPVCTEIVGAMRASSSIVGTDMYSDYPSAVRNGKNSGIIKEVGTYTDPSYESIVDLNPDLVICDGAQYSHVKMANTLRNSNINAVVINNGDDIETVLNNIYIVACAMGYNLRGCQVNDIITKDIEQVRSLMEGRASPSDTVMVTLGTDASPYAASTATYIGDILEMLGWTNVVSGTVSAWPQVISSKILDWNPSVMIVIDNGKYTEDDYDTMLSNLPAVWKQTAAYGDGSDPHIYLISEDAASMAQRYSPRIAQLTEIIARMLDSDAFGSSQMYAVGDDYQDLLTITADAGFDQ